MTSPATPVPGEPPNAPGDATDGRDTSSPPPPAPRALPTAYVAPRNELEAQLAQLWESVLAVVPIGMDDDFFDLGGESLHAFALISRVQRWPIRFSGSAFFMIFRPSSLIVSLG